jgi:hypothetical protein
MTYVMTHPASEATSTGRSVMSSLVFDANTSVELAALPIESATPTVFLPTAPVMATPVSVACVVGCPATFGIGIEPRLPGEPNRREMS